MNQRLAIRQDHVQGLTYYHVTSEKPTKPVLLQPVTSLQKKYHEVRSHIRKHPLHEGAGQLTHKDAVELLSRFKTR